MSYCRQSEVGYLSHFADYTNQLELKKDISCIENEIVLTRNYPKTSGPLVSDWEKFFYVSAFDAGLRLIPRYKVEKYYADFVLIVGE